ncbi:MAG: sigma-70 family RNA polymerase sigma factor [Xanthomonadales bacterium]|nr:sigma-70 family RNA polymerase sigma factor [Xanthomonadales bacterium]
MFPSTRWSLIAASRDSEGGKQQLEELCRIYRGSIQKFFSRYSVPGMETNDVVQDFLLHGFEHDLFGRADRTTGSFRAYLVSAMRQHVGRLLEKHLAAKRGGGAAHESIQDEVLDPDSCLTAEELFDRAFVRDLMQRALESLRNLAVSRGKLAEFDQIERFLIEEPEPGDYARIAASLGMKANTVAVSVARLRAKFKELVRNELRETVTSDSELRQEFSNLRLIQNDRA